MFERLTWRDDRMLLDDLVFRIEPAMRTHREPGDDCFRFYKTRYLVDQYAMYWLTNNEFDARRIFELGIWDGGSVAFWFEYFHPQKHVAIDIARKGDSPYFRGYTASRGLENTIRTFWGVDQGDTDALRRLIHDEFSNELDLVIDDASHIYEPTKTSFETLFPFLRPGGRYVIEDWGWEHWEACYAPSSPLSAERGLTELVFELIGATASSIHLISSVSVFHGFVVIERGDLRLSPGSDFRIGGFVSRRPALSRVRAAAGRGIGRGRRRVRSKVARITRGPRRLLRRLVG